MSSLLCRSRLTGLTEQSNNLPHKQKHTNKTQAHMKTHHLQVTLGRRLKEEVWGRGAESLHSVYSQDFHYTSLFCLSVQSCGMHPTPSPSTSCTHIAPAFAKPILPLLLHLSFLPLHTHTPYSAEHSSSLPPAVSWSSFLPDILLSRVYVC